MSVGEWTHCMCRDCWNNERAGEPVYVHDAEPDTCCFCGKVNSHGIYVRRDPSLVHGEVAYTITDEQIDAAWKQSGYYTRSHAEGMKHALLLLGIVACEECGGRGSWNERTNNITVIQRNCPTCAKFSGHGWVVK